MITLHSPLQSSATCIDYSIEFCIGIATVKRPQKQFLLQNLHSVLRGLNDLSTIRIIVFNAHEDPSKHEEAQMAANFVPVITRDVPLKNVNWTEKESKDYSYLLRECYNTRSKYSLILQDDSILAPTFMLRLKNALERVKEDKDWLLMRQLLQYCNRISNTISFLSQNLDKIVGSNLLFRLVEITSSRNGWWLSSYYCLHKSRISTIITNVNSSSQRTRH
jgi:hypothetical protein